MPTPTLEQLNEGLLLATFLLGDAMFGIDAHQVQEVVKVGDVTHVHHAPPYVVGIRNLRGRIVTVVDLRVRLELGRVSAAPDNRILIVDWQGEPIGLLVDRVADTISTHREAIAPPPSNLHGVQARNLTGVCRAGERLVGLLDLGTLLPADERSTQTKIQERVAA